MSSFICLDSSVLIKLLVNEEDSNKAVVLMDRVINERLTVVLPDFAWTEVGTVLRKKVFRKLISSEQAENAWEAFTNLGVLSFISDMAIMRSAWRIAEEEELPTLYDAAYLAVAEIVSRQYNKTCEFWTADERLVNSVRDKDYVRFLSD
ncbi:nucleic acid-binding protein contains PIN domain- like protein [Desulfofarcimen acetoxidans DSM 771]|jgi:predicted nucleic acid-binding protein|uniref:Nucleic acid-binding protein contains PIN domain-like protein n=1 Tax=Desulfofarcimen acetoxidans (strain ATCC 49208 / DSM 771 / KCTC 5769 / VKM B-1644 / 5575) TaxID=485916 RepID=C8W4Z9_DESAS|nr:type II toxin-antitoxin system VapC family toxin [Desulfofarcimen acetoxidans]ACV61351.1 nucleic acid-binding protein contains PIN domain- like protein [Desulfofarcimen acetoxidans DSM 771]